MSMLRRFLAELRIKDGEWGRADCVTLGVPMAQAEFLSEASPESLFDAGHAMPGRCDSVHLYDSRPGGPCSISRLAASDKRNH